MTEQTKSLQVDKETAGLVVFRSDDALPLEDTGVMSYENMDPATMEKLTLALGPEHHDGANSMTLFQGGGMSLLKVWFKSGYPLARHSHDTECLYYILAGSIDLGTQRLSPGDGFLVRRDKVYSYTAGPQGVELLEFRCAEEFDIKVPSSPEQYWTMLREKMINACSNGWATEGRPSAAATGD